MTLAFCPALDFDPMETQMTFEEIVAILKDNTRTDYQRAADIHAALTKASQPSALTIQPMKQRKARVGRAKRDTPASDSLNGFVGRSETEATHEQ